MSTPITPESLMPLEAYYQWRQTHRADVMAHRRLRTVHLTEYLCLQFESETSMRYQIQEMLRLERIFERERIQDEIDTYAPLVPNGSNWKATLLIGHNGSAQGKAALAQLLGVENRIFVEVQGQERVYAVANEGTYRSADDAPSAVHFLRFEVAPLKAAMLAGAVVMLGCDHPHCTEHVALPGGILASLLGDLG